MTLSLSLCDKDSAAVVPAAAPLQPGRPYQVVTNLCDHSACQGARRSAQSLLHVKHFYKNIFISFWSYYYYYQKTFFEAYMFMIGEFKLILLLR